MVTILLAAGALTVLANRGVAPAMPALGPDLRILDVEWKPTQPMKNDNMFFTVVVENAGDSLAGSFNVSFTVDGSDASWGSARFEGTLLAGQNVTLRSQNAVVAAGNHTIDVVADANLEVVESDELNNEATGSFTALDELRSELSILDHYLAGADVRYAAIVGLGRQVGLDVVPVEEPTSGDHRNRSETNNLILAAHGSWHLGEMPSFWLIHANTHNITRVTTLSNITRNWTHIDSDLYGEQFLKFHHDFIHQYEDFRLKQGYPLLVSWYPALGIPSNFDYDNRQISSRTPPSPPGWLTLDGDGSKDPLYGYDQLGDFPTANRLGKSLEARPSYHASGHGWVGGDMNNIFRSPKDPIFYAWHKHLDDVYHQWENLSHPELVPLDESQLFANVQLEWANLTEDDRAEMERRLQAHLAGDMLFEEHVH